MRVLLLTKRSSWCELAKSLLATRFPALTMFDGDAGTPLPDDVHRWNGDIILSFVCPWILPATVLQRGKYAINFHPAPPSHPGFAPYSWALYEGDKDYGVTIHHMVPKVDAGPIIKVKWFPIEPSDTVWSLQQRAMHHLFDELIRFHPADVFREPSDYAWWRPTRTKADLELLRTVHSRMDQNEIVRRTRAVTYPGQPGISYEAHQ